MNAYHVGSKGTVLTYYQRFLSFGLWLFIRDRSVELVIDKNSCDSPDSV